MPAAIAGTEGADALAGTEGPDLILGFDPGGAAARPTAIEATRLAAGLSQPVFATAAPGDASRLFVVERTGRIEVLDLAGNALAPTPLLDLTGQVPTSGEQGLLGLAFHPGFAGNGRFFVYLSTSAGDTEVREYRATPPGGPADPGSGRLLLRIDQPEGLTNHKGGWIGFGPDGDLHIATGDGGGAGDPFGNAENTGSLLGKILRIDVDGADAFPTDPARNYAIPAGNPFAGGGGSPEVWAYGLRNPWRDSFDRATGELWIGDVGQDRFEEIDIGAPGANFGWNRFEGNAPFTPGADATGLVPPVFTYGRDTGSAITGGTVYRGPEDALQGAYVFADSGSGRLFSLLRDAAGGPPGVTELTGLVATAPGEGLGTPVSFGEDAEGRLYAVDFDGELYRLTPRSAVADGPDRLEGGAGDDRIHAGAGDDLARGGDGADLLFGMRGDDSLEGGSGDDGLEGGEGFDVLDGGPGNDRLTGGPGGDWLEGSEGSDTVVLSGLPSQYQSFVSAGRVLALGPDGGDVLLDVEFVSFPASGRTLALADLLAQTGAGAPIFAQTDLATGRAAAVEATPYSGPVAGLALQYLGNAGGQAVAGTGFGDFINTLGGDDAANGGAGRDVIDGGTGSNFLSGGADLDVFFLDGRGRQTTWSTIADWQPGEQLSVWGWRPGVSRAAWFDRDGAPGFEGATLHADLDGDGVLDTSVTWTGLSRSALPAPLEFDGLLWFR